jgi:hypothetical protein
MSASDGLDLQDGIATASAVAITKAGNILFSCIELNFKVKNQKNFYKHPT